jgi:8-oxo-dGTP pyrophosphatase MutT (NUDIX family)
VISNGKELHRVTSTAIIYKDGRFLIIKRSSKKKVFPGKWTVPGGGLSTDDYVTKKPTTSAGQWYGAITDSLRREVIEEVNLEIEKPEYLLDLAFLTPDGTPVICLSYYAAYKSGRVMLDEDATEYAWVTPEEAKNYDLIPGIAEEIEMVDKILKNLEKIKN